MRTTMTNRLEYAVAEAIWNMIQSEKIIELENRLKFLETRKPGLLRDKAIEICKAKIKLAYNAETVDDLDMIE